MDFLYKYKELLYPPIQSLPISDLCSSVEVLMLKIEQESPEVLVPIESEDEAESEVMR
jgi:hypothetical protein